VHRLQAGGEPRSQAGIGAAEVAATSVFTSQLPTARDHFPRPDDPSI